MKHCFDIRPDNGFTLSYSPLQEFLCHRIRNTIAFLTLFQEIQTSIIQGVQILKKKKKIIRSFLHVTLFGACYSISFKAVLYLNYAFTMFLTFIFLNVC